MRKRLKVLAAVGIGAVAAAAGAAFWIRSSPPSQLSAPPTATPAPDASPAAPEAAAAPMAAKVAPDQPLELEPGGTVGDVKLGGWLKGAELPLCGRVGDVRLRGAAGDEAAEKGTLPSCEAAYSEYPAVTLFPIRSRKGDWIQLPDGWVRIDEVRTAETLVVDGVEYWLDLFNMTVDRVDARRVTLKGDTDPCAGEVCGNGHGLWEQEQELRTQLASQHPDGKVPPEATEELDRRIAELNEAAEKEHADAVKAAEDRAREERTLELPAAGQGRKLDPQVEGGGYLCCT